MRLTRDLEAVPGVRRAAAMMGTEPNRALLSQAGLLAADGEHAGPADLVIATVPLEAAVALKREAAARGLFVLGPDCGTAILHGIPLGFANAVPRGRVGLVATSGTGLQEVTCLLAAEGEGVSHAIGVGSRDLSDAVGGAMTLPALAALREDAATEVVVVVGKPPGPTVVASLVDR